METITKEIKQPKLGQIHNQKINGYNTEIGMININNPYSCYSILGGWVIPTNSNLGDEMKLFERQLRFIVDRCSNAFLKDYINPEVEIIKIVEQSTTKNFDSANQRINNNFTYFSIELTFFFIKEVSIRDKAFLEKMEIILYAITDALSENRNLIFQPTKKG